MAEIITYSIIIALFAFIIYFGYALFIATTELRDNAPKHLGLLGPLMFLFPNHFTDKGNKFRIHVLYMLVIMAAIIVVIFSFGATLTMP